MPSPEITGVVIFHFLQFELIKILMGSVMNHCPDRFAFMHKLEGVIDFIQCHRMGYKWLKVNIPLHGILDHTGELSAAFTPPNAEPFHTRPVTSWKGRVEISCPAPATPMTTDCPHPR